MIVFIVYSLNYRLINEQIVIELPFMTSDDHWTLDGYVVAYSFSDDGFGRSTLFAVYLDGISIYRWING